jgi:hypothetical protein
MVAFEVINDFNLLAKNTWFNIKSTELCTSYAGAAGMLLYVYGKIEIV